MTPIASDLSYEVALKRIRDRQFHVPQLSKANLDRFHVEQPVDRLWDSDAEPSEPVLTIVEQVRR